jgi:hypothetical protein
VESGHLQGDHDAARGRAARKRAGVMSGVKGLMGREAH